MNIDKKIALRLDYRFWAKWGIVVAIFIFLGKTVWENWALVKEASFTFRILPLFSATFLFALSYFIQIWAWYLITVKLNVAISYRETLIIWFFSQLGKYLPGKVWLLLSRFYLYESKGKSKNEIMISLYFETMTMVVAAGLLFLASLLFSRNLHSTYSGFVYGGAILLFLVTFFLLHPKVLLKIFNPLLVFLKRDPISISLSYSDVLWILGVCVLCWIVGGIGFSLFIHSVFTISSESFLFLTGALAISSTLGLLALFAPSGLGVREGVLVYLLSSIMPTSVAVILSVLTRLWMTLIEIGLIGVVYLLNKFRKKE